MATPVQENLAKFNISTVTYKTVNSHAITTDVFIPKSLPAGKYPMLVRFHGGGLITGGSSSLAFLAPWILQYCIQHSAILVMPNYRLLPESNGHEILSDLIDFWSWTATSLPDYLTTSFSGHPAAIVPDFSRLLVQGESAGGWFALQSILQPHPLVKNIKGVISAYAMLDILSPWFIEPISATLPKAILGLPVQPLDVMPKYLETLQERRRNGEDVTISYADPPARFDLMLAALQQGLFLEIFGSDPKLSPVEILELKKVDGKSLPKLFLYHGLQDSAVPVEGSKKVVALLEESGARLVASYQDGDHAFDNSPEITPFTPWLKEGLDFVQDDWLA
jgi:acetyl esterase/lipase